MVSRMQRTDSPSLFVMASPSNSSSATASRLPSFETRVQEVSLSKSRINSLVMDYLISEGYPEAAQNFAMEANIPAEADFDTVQDRVAIRNRIYGGDIQNAIERINEINPQILDSDRALHFALLRLQLVELIRTCTATPGGDITPALDFATNHLAPRASFDPNFLQDLEHTMALLVFGPDNLGPQLAELLDPKLRHDVATRVNAAILRGNGERTKSRLHDLIRTRFWAEKQARQAKKDIPDTLSLGLDVEKSDVPMTGDGAMRGNGEADAMAT